MGLSIDPGAAWRFPPNARHIAARWRSTRSAMTQRDRQRTTRRSNHHGPSTRRLHEHERRGGGTCLSVFLACAVEAVEALTIVLAVGATRSWSSAMSGVGGRHARARRDHGGARPGAHRAPDRRAAPGGRRAAAGLRPAVAAQGDPARGRLEGHARRAARSSARRPRRRAPPAPGTPASTGTRSRSPSRACSWRAWRWRSSCSPSAPTSTTSRSPRPPPRLAVVLVVSRGCRVHGPRSPGCRRTR